MTALKRVLLRQNRCSKFLRQTRCGKIAPAIAAATAAGTAGNSGNPTNPVSPQTRTAGLDLQGAPLGALLLPVFPGCPTER